MTDHPFQGRRVPKGSSDASQLTCTCKLSLDHPVLLFYRYFDTTPPLPQILPSSTNQPSLSSPLIQSSTSPPAEETAQISTRSTEASLSQAHFHQSLCSTLSITGKIRVGPEGLNCTISGTSSSIATYISTLTSHWSLSDLDLKTLESQNKFFKPSPGCPHVFEGKLSVKVVEEITPLGVRNYIPDEFASSPSPSDSSSQAIRSSSVDGETNDAVKPSSEKRKRKLIYRTPSQFHALFSSSTTSTSPTPLLLDTRNAYESRVGYFPSAILPPIRKFGGLPGYMEACWPELKQEMRRQGRREVLTYCTGGVRCEKGGRLIVDRLLDSSSGAGEEKEVGGEELGGEQKNNDGVEEAEAETEDEITVSTLEGGIVAYLDWVESEVQAGRMQKSESLFKGRNYLFDARGSVGLGDEDVCATGCFGCGEATARLGKCRGKGCCIVLVLCGGCGEDGEGVFCCEGCRVISKRVDEGARRKGVCDCEKDREAKEKRGEILRATP